jgi:hypothetical protein
MGGLHAFGKEGRRSDAEIRSFAPKCRRLLVDLLIGLQDYAETYQDAPFHFSGEKQEGR